MKNLMMGLVLALVSQQCLALELSEGDFKGELSAGGDVHLLLKSAPGRDKSFLAIMMNKGEKISFYLIDPFKDSKYTMTPYVVNSKGAISIVDDNPSLNLLLSTDRGGNTIFDVVDSGSGNESGFKQLMKFRNKTSNYHWNEPTSGPFRREGSLEEALVLSDKTSDGDIGALFKEAQLSGEFQAHEAWPNLFTVNQVKTMSTGELVSSIPKRIGVFVENCFITCAQKFYLVNPTVDTDILTYVRK